MLPKRGTHEREKRRKRGYRKMSKITSVLTVIQLGILLPSAFTLEVLLNMKSFH